MVTMQIGKIRRTIEQDSRKSGRVADRVEIEDGSYAELIWIHQGGGRSLKVKDLTRR